MELKNSGPYPYPLLLRFISLAFLCLSLKGVSWKKLSTIKDVVVAQRRRMKNSWVLMYLEDDPFGHLVV